MLVNVDCIRHVMLQPVGMNQSAKMLPAMIVWVMGEEKPLVCRPDVGMMNTASERVSEGFMKAWAEGVKKIEKKAEGVSDKLVLPMPGSNGHLAGGEMDGLRLRL